MNALERYQKKIAGELEVRTGFFQELSEIQKNILVALHATLLDIFPRTTSLLSELIEQLEQEYLQNFPPRFASMELCVSYFPLFLKEKARKKKIANFVAELADLEWSIFFVGVDPLDEETLRSQLNPKSVCLNPISRILKLEYDVLKLLDLPINELSNVNVEPSRNVLLISRFRDLREIKKNHLNLEMAQILDLLEDQPISFDSLKILFTQHSPNPELFDNAFKQLLDIQAVIAS